MSNDAPIKILAISCAAKAPELAEMFGSLRTPEQHLNKSDKKAISVQLLYQAFMWIRKNH